MADLKKLTRELAEMPEGSIALVETGEEMLGQVGLISIKSLTDSGFSVLLLSASRPYQNLSSIYKAKGVDLSRLYCIDCISKSHDSGVQDSDNVRYLANVSDLTEMLLAINGFLSRMKGKKFMFIDSVSTMLIYNRPDTLAKFIHITLTKLRLSGTSAVLIAVDGQTNKEVRAEIVQLCDSVIKV